MVKDEEEAANIMRKCVVRFAREKGADLEMGAPKRGRRALLSTKNLPVLCRDQMSH